MQFITQFGVVLRKGERLLCVITWGQQVSTEVYIHLQLLLPLTFQKGGNPTETQRDE